MRPLSLILKNTPRRGSAFLLALFFSALFIVMFGATLNYIVVQHRAVQNEVWRTQALNMAEAGAHYYRWHLAHAPTDYTTDTGVSQYDDPQGGEFGEYDITVTAPEASSTSAIITVQANTVESPTTKARVRVRYGRPSLAHYAFLTNSNVWFGAGEEVSGELHSNGGVRMDGVGDSLLTSAKNEYICGDEHGCDNETKPGIWGTGDDPVFWKFPVETLDFNTIMLNLDEIETEAANNGIYLSPSRKQGYYIKFNNNGTLSVFKVTQVYSEVDAYNGVEWIKEANNKKDWQAVNGYQNIPFPDNGLIFVDDDLWVSGEVNGRVTVVAARLPDGSATRANIYIQEDITYVSRDGNDVLGLIAQQDVLVPLRSDNVLEINAALVAVNGHVFRYYYAYSNTEPYKTYALRDKIETYGTIITNTVWTWSWVSAADGPVVSGYRTTETTYDPNLTYGPPPSFPTEDEYAFISWEELTLTEE